MLLLGTELVILLVSVAYFAGLSVGYLWSGRIRAGWLPWLAGGTLILHLTLPIVFRLISGWFYTRNIFWVAFIVLPLLVPFTVSAFYSILLPLYIDNGSGRLVDLYAVELGGAALGILLLVNIGSMGLTVLYIVYTSLLFVLLMQFGLRRLWVAVLGIAAAGWLIALPMLDAASNAYWFGQVFDLLNPTTVFSAYSPYQKVDIIDDSHGQRYLFLNGLIDYGTNSWNRLNVALGEVPARLMQPSSMVTVGSGSMALEGLVSEHVGHVTTVELDPVVLGASHEFFDYINHTDQLPNWSYVIDDAKHFFANTPDRYNLVTMNVPAPLTAQTATLYSASFYASVKARLEPKGVLAVSLTRKLTADATLPRRIAAGLLANFAHVIAVTPSSVGITFVYASDDLPFDTTDVQFMFQATGEQEFAIMDETALRALVGSATPITLDDLDVSLGESLRRMRDLVEPWQP